MLDALRCVSRCLFPLPTGHCRADARWDVTSAGGFDDNLDGGQYLQYNEVRILLRSTPVHLFT